VSQNIAATLNHLELHHDNILLDDESIGTIDGANAMQCIGNEVLILDNIFDPMPSDEPGGDIYHSLTELLSKQTVSQTDVFSAMAMVCAKMEMKLCQAGAITQDHKVQSYTCHYFSKMDKNVNGEGNSPNIESDLVKRGAIVILNDCANNQGPEHYRVLAVFSKHYNKYWLANCKKNNKKADTRVLFCHV